MRFLMIFSLLLLMTNWGENNHADANLEVCQIIDEFPHLSNSILILLEDYGDGQYNILTYDLSSHQIQDLNVIGRLFYLSNDKKSIFVINNIPQQFSYNQIQNTLLTQYNLMGERITSIDWGITWSEPLGFTQNNDIIFLDSSNLAQFKQVSIIGEEITILGEFNFKNDFRFDYLARISPNSGLVAFTETFLEDGQLVIASLNTINNEILWRGDSYFPIQLFNSLMWSPNGEFLVFPQIGIDSWQFLKWDIALLKTEPITNIIPLSSDVLYPVFGLRWSPDSSHIAYGRVIETAPIESIDFIARIEPSVYITNTLNSETKSYCVPNTLLYNFWSPDIAYLAWSPDMNYLAFGSSISFSGIHILEVSTGKIWGIPLSSKVNILDWVNKE